MSIPTSVLVKMASLGLSAEQAEAVAAMLSDVEAATLETLESAQEKSKEKARARWRKWKDNQPSNVGKRLPTTANASKRLTRGEDSSSNQEITGKEEKKVASPSARPSRGSRIPDDFCPDIEAAVSEGVPRLEAERQARSFCDYWRSKPGAGGLKLDWPATWRVWYRRNIPTVSKPQATAPPRKQTVGQQARDELKRMETLNNAPNNLPRYYDESDGEPGFAGTGIARRIAIAASR